MFVSSSRSLSSTMRARLHLMHRIFPKPPQLHPNSPAGRTALRQRLSDRGFSSYHPPFLPSETVGYRRLKNPQLTKGFHIEIDTSTRASVRGFINVKRQPFPRGRSDACLIGSGWHKFLADQLPYQSICGSTTVQSPALALRR